MNIKEQAQAAIDAVIEQGAKSTYGNSCMYRSDAGCCVVGHMITDEVYCHGLEQHAVTMGSVIEAVEESIGLTLTSEDLELLKDLQRAHDSTSDDGDFVESFKKKAEAVMRISYEHN